MKLFFCATLVLSGVGLASASVAQEAASAAMPPHPAQLPAQQVTVAPQPMLVAQPVAQTSAILPQNTEVVLRLNEELTTKKHKEGDAFYLTVVYDVMLGGYVIIPKGTRATGLVTWTTGKGMLGKSGKMEIEIRQAEVGGRRIPLTGKFRQEGEGNTVATIGAVVAIPIAGLLVTGRSGTIPQGREFIVHTRDDLPVAFAATPPTPPPAQVVYQPAPAVQSAPAASVQASPVPAPISGAVVPD